CVGPCITVSLDVLTSYPPGYRETKDGLRTVDAVSSCKRYTGLLTNGPAPLQYFPCHLGWDLVYGPTQNGNGHQGFTTHGIDVADGIDRSNGPERCRVIHDGHKKVGCADDTVAVARIKDRRIVACLVADQKLGVQSSGGITVKDPVEHRRRNLAAASRPMTELCKSYFFHNKLLVITRLQKFRDAEVHIYTIPANAIAQSVCVTRQAALVRLIVIAKQYIDRCVHIPGYEHITCRVEVLASKLSGDPLHCLKK